VPIRLFFCYVTYGTLHLFFSWFSNGVDALNFLHIAAV
jgi:hypothetical protein